MGVNEENERYKSLITLKHVSRIDLTLTTVAPFVNVHASYHIGSNPIDLEDTPSFTKANLSPSFDQGTYPSLGLLLSSPLLMFLIVHLSDRSLIKP
jgi:hypothetical protein